MGITTKTAATHMQPKGKPHEAKGLNGGWCVDADSSRFRIVSAVHVRRVREYKIGEGTATAVVFGMGKRWKNLATFRSKR